MILIYTTCESLDQAKKISKHLLHEKLCACTNIIPAMHSLYLWPPKSNIIEEGNEVILIIKTVKKHFKNIEKEIRSLHSYETPAIFSLPVQEVSKKYFDWLSGEVSPQ